INAPASILLALLLVVAERRGTPWAALSGTIQNDILKEYAARGTYIFPPAPSLGMVTDIFEFCAKEVPRWNTISVSGYHIREAGSTAVQEVAFTLANGLQYVKAAVDRGLGVDTFAPRMSFFFNAHNDFLEEVSKFRAARKLWATLMRERYEPHDPRSLALRFHAQTAGSTLTADPLAGSYAVESATLDIERDARALIDKIDGMGGALAAIESGFVQRAVGDSAYAAQQAIEKKQSIVVGINEFTDDRPSPLPILTIDESVERDQVARLREFRQKRRGDVGGSLEVLDRAARGGKNVMPPIVDCVRNECTIGEI